MLTIRSTRKSIVRATLALVTAATPFFVVLDRNLRLPHQGRHHPEAAMSITEYVLVFAGVMLFLGGLALNFFFPALRNSLQNLMTQSLNVLNGA